MSERQVRVEAPGLGSAAGAKLARGPWVEWWVVRKPTLFSQTPDLRAQPPARARVNPSPQRSVRPSQ